MTIQIEDIKDIERWIGEAIASIPDVYRDNVKVTIARMDEREVLFTMMKFKELSTNEKIKHLWDYSIR